VTCCLNLQGKRISLPLNSILKKRHQVSAKYWKTYTKTEVSDYGKQQLKGTVQKRMWPHNETFKNSSELHFSHIVPPPIYLTISIYIGKAIPVTGRGGL
jgi:hypothetical protein